MKKFIKIIFLIIIFNSNIYSAPNYQIDNLDFENGMVGSIPYSWNFPNNLSKLGYICSLTDSIKYSNKMSLKMINPNNAPPTNPEDENYCTIYQNIDPYYYLNKRIRFSIYAKLDTKLDSTYAQLWIFAKNHKDSVLLYHFDEKNNIKLNNWQKYSIEVDIPLTATELRFGVIMNGGGTIFLDNATFDVVNPSSYKAITTRNLSSNESKNIRNLAKVYGALRYFAPSDEAFKMNWDEYLVDFLSNENNKNMNLKDYMVEFSKPFNSLFTVGNSEMTGQLASKPKVSYDLISYSMLYRGFPNNMYDPTNSNFRRNIYAITRRREGSINKIIDLIKYENKELRVSCDIKVDGQSPGANAQLWARTSMLNTEEFRLETTANNPVKSGGWQKRTISMKIPPKVFQLRLALVFLGEGRAFYDNIKVEIYDNNKLVKSFDDENLNFEKPSNKNNISGWEIEPQVIQSGYSFEISNKDKKEGKQSLSIITDGNRINYPKEGELYSVALDDNLYFSFPLCVYTDSVNTLPKSSNFSSYQNHILYKYNDVNARIAALIQVYSILENFAYIKIDPHSLDSAFSVNLTKILKEVDNTKILYILSDFIKLAKDSRIRLWNVFENMEYTLPFILSRDNDRYLIKAIFDSTMGISVGDEIIKFDNKDIDEYINEVKSNFYSSNDDVLFTRVSAIIRAGRQDEEVSLKVKKTNNETIVVRVKRNVRLNDVYEIRPQAIKDLDEKTVYIDMTQLYDNFFKEYLNQLDQFQNFVFDLRGEALMSEHVLTLFTNKTLNTVDWKVPIYTYPQKKNIRYDTIHGELVGKEKFKNKNLYFLINNRTVGYSEYIAKIVKENQLGKLVGFKTFGNASETVSERLAGGYTITISSLIAKDKNSQDLFNYSIEPDILYSKENINSDVTLNILFRLLD